MIRRLLYSIVVLFAASFLVFSFVTVSGDPLAGSASRPTSRRRRSRRHGAQAPRRKHSVRYWYWVKDAITNQFGTTLLDETPDPARPLARDEEHAAARPRGRAARDSDRGGDWRVLRLRQYSVFDYSATTLSFLGLATPLFWLALMVQVLIVYVYNWTGHRVFPIANLNSVDPGQGIHFAVDRAHHLVMPVMVLMIASVATYSRYMRASMLEVVNSDYVRTARAKGLNEHKVTMKHAFRNALIPLVTVVALNFGALLSGAVVTETVFSLDGMGLYFINALGTADPYPVMAWLMITATLIIIFNLLADILYGFLDPRVRYD